MKKEKIVAWGVVGVMYLFILCHISALVGEVGYVGALMDFYNHIIAKPFDVLYFDKYVFMFGWLGFLSIALINLCKVEKPKADMKGAEHGSNDFHTDEERDQFLADCTTPILAYIEPEVKKDEN